MVVGVDIGTTSVKELVLHALTGEWVMDHSTASGTGLMDLSTLDWDPEALALAGLCAPGATACPSARRAGALRRGAFGALAAEAG